MEETEARAVEGTVLEALPNAMFRVALADGHTVRAHVGRGLRMKVVRILPGDRVKVALSSYDATRGRIVQRHGSAEGA